MHFSRVLLGGVGLTCWVEVYEVSDSIFLAGECWSAGSPGGLGEAAPSQAEGVGPLPGLLPQPESVQARESPVPESPELLPGHQASNTARVML